VARIELVRMQMGKETLLVIDDEEDILELVSLCLAREGYNVLCAETGEEGWEIAKSKLPALVILDLMLPGMSGLDFCRILKHNSRTHNIPVLILTAKSEDSDVVVGFELGADDYVTKPFSPSVLVARVRRVLRRQIARSLDRERVVIHDLVIDPARCEATAQNRRLDLTFSEFNILYTLAKRPGVVFTRYQIMDSVHGSDYIATERAVDVQIAYLRKKLGRYKDYIETVRGVGYRFRDRE
jgi:two-component system phosphate regulon response regulator PhoB